MKSEMWEDVRFVITVIIFSMKRPLSVAQLMSWYLHEIATNTSPMRITFTWCMSWVASLVELFLYDIGFKEDVILERNKREIKIWTTLKHARGWLIKLVFIYKYIIFNHLQIYIFLISPKLILSRTSSSSLYKTWKVAPYYHPMEAFLDCLKPRRDILTIKCWKHRKS